MVKNHVKWAIQRIFQDFRGVLGFFCGGVGVVGGLGEHFLFVIHQKNNKFRKNAKNSIGFDT